MPAICTGSVSPHNCGHRTLTIDGRTLHLHASDLAPLSDAEVEQLFALAIRYKGVALADLLNRVVVGDEATNVKIYSFFGPGAAITKTNIGTNYVNICPGFDGEPIVADFTGCTEYRLQLHCNVVGTGQLGVRVIRFGGDNAVLHESANVGAAGERGPDTDWQPLPAAFLGQGLMYLRAQAKSTTGADDPVMRSLRVGLR